MNSRLKNYLESAKIAKLFLNQAMEAKFKGNDKMALQYLLSAVNNMIAANNNLASIAFNAKPKK